MTSTGRVGFEPKLLLIVFAVAFALRLANLCHIATEPEIALTEDASLYWNGARDWIDSGSFSRRSGLATDHPTYLPEHERVPGYFLFLLPIRAIFGEMHIPVLFVQSLLDALTCVLIALLGHRISRETGLLAGSLAAVWPNMIIHSGLILTETVFLFLTALLMLAALRFADTLRLRDAWLTGLLCGAAIMVRPVIQFIPLLIIAATAALPILRRRGWRIAVSASVMLVLGTVIPVAPHVLRNYIVFDTPRLTSQTGVHLLYWVASQVEQIEGDATFDELTDRYSTQLETRLAARGILPDASDPFERDAEMQRLAATILAAQPWHSIASAWLQGATLNLFTPAILADPRIRRLKQASFMDSTGGDIFGRARNLLATAPPPYLTAAIVGALGSIASSVLAAFGVFVALRQAPLLALLNLGIIVYFLLVTGPVASPKYRIPIEPAIILFCAAALTAIATSWRRVNRHHPPDPT